MKFSDLKIGDWFKRKDTSFFSYKKIEEDKYCYPLTNNVYVTHPDTPVIKIKDK